MRKVVLYFLVFGYLFTACTGKTKDHHHEDPENRATADSTVQIHDHDSHDHEMEEHDEHDEHEIDQEEHSHEMEGQEEHDHEHESVNSGTEHLHAQGEDAHEDHDAHDLDHAVIHIEPQAFSEVIRSSGKIMNTKGNEIIVSAVHNGRVLFTNQQLLPGMEVNKNSRLLLISGTELIHDNIRTGYQEALNTYQKARLNYERAEELNEDKIISDRELEDLKVAYENARNNYENMRKNYTDGGSRVNSPLSGYVKEVYVSEGEYVETGQPLIKIAESKHLLLEAEVPQEYFGMINQITSANFVTPYNEKVYQLSELNGEVVSYGKTTGDNSLFMPVYFRIENKGNLIPGSFVEVFLQGTEIPGSLLVPKSAVLEESGSYYVFVKEGEEFAKHYVKLNGFDGLHYRVTDGLSEGMEVATKNTYLIKLSQMSGSIPQHSHSH